MLGPRPLLLAAGLVLAGALGLALPIGRGEPPLRITKFALPGSGRNRTPSVPAGAALRALLTINRPAWVYVFGVDGETGAVRRLFPDPVARVEQSLADDPWREVRDLVGSPVGPGRVVLPGSEGELPRGLTDRPGRRALVAGASPVRLEDAVLRTIEEEVQRAAREESRPERAWKAARAALERRFPEAVGFAFDVLP
jgi:hypothetical protein